MRLIYYFASALFFLVTAAAAEPALHVVGIYEGSERTGDLIHGSRANVVLDRPGEEVTLVLTAYEATRWIVKVEDGTIINRIALGGHGAARSEVYLANNNGDERFENVSILSELRHSYRADGPTYRSIVAELPAQLGFDALSTFQGSYRAETAPFVIDKDTVVPVTQDPDYLALFLQSSDVVPEEMRHLLDYEPIQAPTFRFSRDTLTWVPVDGAEQSFPVSLDVPRISGGAGTFVESEMAIYWVTWSGEGFLYRLDVQTGQWSVVRSMLQEDANSMVYDPERQHMLMPGGFPSFKGVWIEDLIGGTTLIPVSTDELVGLTDLYDSGNGPSPYVRGLAVQGDALLVVADGTGTFQRQVSDTAAYRMWLIDLTDGSAQLVSYRN